MTPPTRHAPSLCLEEWFAKGVGEIPHGAAEKIYADILAGRQPTGPETKLVSSLDVPGESGDKEAVSEDGASDLEQGEREPGETLEEHLARALEDMSPATSEEGGSGEEAVAANLPTAIAVARPAPSEHGTDARSDLGLVQRVLRSTKFGVFSIVPKQANSKLRYGGFQARCVFHKPAS